ncbi:MAG: hypothetical protein PHI99_02410 [Syntrophales bacterium]|nr:hypothetical protein [Syntrophales bacterium]
MREVQKLFIATELLDRALQMYYEGNSYFASLHLAGAAEEVLAAYVKKYGGTSSFEFMRDFAVMLSKTEIVKNLIDDGVDPTEKNIADIMNRAKNTTKHMNETDDDFVHFDAQAEAKDLLDRAVTNYYYLMSFLDLEETRLLRQFNAELVKE